VIAVLLGPPGVGKGTQATMLCDAYGWYHLSSGEVLRRASDEESDIGNQIRQYTEVGAYVPDSMMLHIIMDKITQAAQQQGVLLDGFPRTVVQAESLDDALDIDHSKVNLAILLEADVEQLVKRLAGRLTCRRCGAVYHTTYHPPKEEGICDRCHGALYRRADDDEATVRRRMNVYMDQTRPLVDYYDGRGVLVRVDGSEPIDAVYHHLEDIITGAKV